ncbi:MAG: glutamine synthetase [Cyanobacteria bacterium K_Offshore_surface_m2_011]|nr:glutamine synthetase [Cyanobacteria bacterium K_Offshore_surface_m2_011]
MAIPPDNKAAALAAQGIRWVAITWVNHAGAPLVKVVPLTGFEAAVAVGVGFSPVADAFGAGGGIDPAHRLARPDGDLRLRADAAALAPLEPASGWAWAPGERYERSGAPYPGDQRHLCRRQMEQLQRAGVELRAGFELEWLVAVPAADGTPAPAIPGGPYGADRLVEGLDYATALLEALEAAGLPWLQFHPEYGASQFELSLAPGTPLEAADRLVHAKLLIQRVTRRFGWRCSFSPKPSLERVGNGGHLHLSVRQGGTALLEGGTGEAGLSDAGAGVLAALLEELPALLALACPLAVSYRRLAPGSWSAPFQVWGVENREAALRLVPAAADGVPAHLELKVADLAANPYLLLGAVQAVVADGLARARPLPPPVVGDPAGRPAGTAERLPARLAEASAAFAASDLLHQALGEALHGSLCDSQAAEVRRAAGCSETELVAADAWWPVVGGIG